MISSFVVAEMFIARFRIVIAIANLRPNFSSIIAKHTTAIRTASSNIERVNRSSFCHRCVACRSHRWIYIVEVRNIA